MNESDVELIEGSGHVFRDLGDPDADLKQAKAVVAARIIAVLDNRGLTVRKGRCADPFRRSGFLAHSQR